MAISAEGISVNRLGRRVLHEVSLRIEDGQCVSIIGPNGAGKSTLMATLLGLLPLEAGDVQIGGTLLSRLTRRQIARQVAYVPQIHEGYLGFRVRDVVESGRFAYLDPLAPLSEADRWAIDEAVAVTHIAELLDRPVDTLSGGERQKAWIAAALAQQTPALFLDEPTNALDPAHQVELIRMMRSLSAAGKTLVVICHDLNLPLALGGRVAAIRRGRLALDDKVDALLDLDRLKTIFDTDFTLHREGEAGSWSVHLRV